LCSSVEITCNVSGKPWTVRYFLEQNPLHSEAADLSREVVAERADMNANYLGEIERGEKWPSLEIIQRLAGTLSVSPSAFLEFEAEETDSNILLTNYTMFSPIEIPTNSSRHFDFSGLSSNSDSR